MADLGKPFPIPGSGSVSPFATVETLIVHYARHLPLAYVRAVIEAEKEIFVVRRECTLQETHAQFLRKCEGALARSLAEAQAGLLAWEWSYVAPVIPSAPAVPAVDPRLSSSSRNAFLSNPPA